MSAARELIAALVAGGMDPVDAATMAARAAVELSPPGDTRTPGAKRQAAYRARHKTSPSVTEVTANDASQNVTKRNEASLSDITSLSKEEKKESKEERKRETTRGSRLPDGWTPTDQDWQSACQLIGEPKAKSELEKFRDHWAQQPGARGVKLDWNAAWRNWVRRSAEYSAPRHGAQNGRRTVHDAANDLTARLQALDEPAPGSICGGEGEGAFRLISPR